MKKIFLFTIANLSALISFAQVPKKVVVEHFTNSRCSACAARNPSFYTNLNSNPGVIHLAVHPSSPYSSCLLNQHNVSENDARTTFYGIYGSTPRLVVQGVVVSGGADYSSSAIFAPYLGQMSPASIKITQLKYGTDSIRSRVVIKTEGTHSLGALKLFVALAEDTLNYASPNGETVHNDVFRKSLTGATGINVTLAATIGDSVVFTMVSTVSSTWNFSQIFTLAILQESVSKAVVQSQSVLPNIGYITTGISNLQNLNSNIAVVSIENGILVKQDKLSDNTILTIYDMLGKVIIKKEINDLTEQLLNINKPQGLYLYTITSNNTLLKTGKIILD
jgi:hypothetical protein